MKFYPYEKGNSHAEAGGGGGGGLKQFSGSFPMEAPFL